MRVRELMHHGLITCKPEATLGAAAALLAEHRVHALIVADPNGRPLGLLSDSDVLAGEWLSLDDASFATMKSLTAADLMSAPPVMIDAGAPAVEAAMRLRADRMSRLLVSENGVAVGVVAISDLVRALGRAPTNGRATVGDVMSWGIVTCRDDTPLHAAARAMNERRSRSIVIIDRNGTTVGVLTGTDLLPLYDSGSLEQTVASLMNPPLTITPDATLREAADEMLRREVHRLVVVEADEAVRVPLGMISTSDIVVEMAAPTSIWQAM